VIGRDAVVSLRSIGSKGRRLTGYLLYEGLLAVFSAESSERKKEEVIIV
jgi:hypothetical protein